MQCERVADGLVSGSSWSATMNAPWVQSGFGVVSWLKFLELSRGRTMVSVVHIFELLCH